MICLPANKQAMKPKDTRPRRLKPVHGLMNPASSDKKSVVTPVEGIVADDQRRGTGEAKLGGVYGARDASNSQTRLIKATTAEEGVAWGRFGEGMVRGEGEVRGGEGGAAGTTRRRRCVLLNARTCTQGGP